MQGKLTTSEKKLVIEIAKIQQQSFIRLAESDLELREIFSEGLELEEYTKLDLAETIVDELEFFENLEKDPDLLFQIDQLNLRTVRLIIAQQISNDEESELYRKFLNKLELMHLNSNSIN